MPSDLGGFAELPDKVPELVAFGNQSGGVMLMREHPSIFEPLYSSPAIAGKMGSCTTKKSYTCQ